MAPGEALPWELSDYDSLYFFSDDRTNWGDALNRHANFAYFWTGILLLIRASTGEYFNGIMHDCHSYSWGWNRLTCCPECGPIVDGNSDAAGVLLTAEGKYVQLGLTIPSTGQVVNRVVPENSCGSTTSAWKAVSVASAFRCSQLGWGGPDTDKSGVTPVSHSLDALSCCSIIAS